jgi:uncharacterized protein (DUF1778 family)
MINSPSKHSNQVERIEARISSAKKMVLKNAAELSGRTLTDFVIDSAYEEAMRLIQEHQQLHLSMKDSELFIKALLRPPKPNRALSAAAKKYKRNVRSK